MSTDCSEMKVYWLDSGTRSDTLSKYFLFNGQIFVDVLMILYVFLHKLFVMVFFLRFC